MGTVLTDTENTTRSIPVHAGIFTSLEHAETAVDKLVQAGFTNEEITVVCAENSPAAERFKEFEHQHQAGVHTGSAMLAGGGIGATLGAVATLTGVVATGGIGLLAMGAIVAGVGGLTGTFVGAMMTRGVEKELADFYDQEVSRGNILVAVDIRHQIGDSALLKLADQILREAGAKPYVIPKT